MSSSPIDPISAFGAHISAADPVRTSANATQSFGRLLMDGVQQTNQKVLDADRLVRAFAVDDTVPLHQVTYALEQARQSVELMSQLRSRLVEGYQELFRMQL